MVPTKKIESRVWFSVLLACLVYFGASAQDNRGSGIADPDSPRIVSSDCDPSESSCIGNITWEDGSKYEGEIRFGKINGSGKLLLADGSSYEGEFKDGVFHGNGTMAYEDGAKYTGEWNDGYREGQGSLVFPDGAEYLGEFLSDLMHGEGSMILASGETYSGGWEFGQPHGYGTINRLDGSVYYGMLEEGTRHGSGMIVWESKDTLHGSWAEGKMTDEGIFQFQDGSTMICYWENGVMKEENTYIKPDGVHFTATNDDLANVILHNTWNDTETVERNFGMAFYAIGMEYKSNLDFERAEKNLQFAAQFGDDIHSPFIKEMVQTEMANIGIEKQNASGTVKLSEEEED